MGCHIVQDLMPLFAAALPDVNKDILESCFTLHAMLSWHQPLHHVVHSEVCAYFLLKTLCAALPREDPNGEVRMMLDTLREFLRGVRPEDPAASVLKGQHWGGMCDILRQGKLPFHVTT